MIDDGKELVKGYSISLDILRIIFCVMVVWLHVPSFYGNVGDILEYSVTSICVAGFMAISGYLLFYKKEYSYKEILRGPFSRYFIMFLLWSTIVVLSNYTKDCGDLGTFWAQNSEGWHLWYLKVYVQILFVYPIIRSITRDKKVAKMFAVMWIIFFSIKYTISSYPGLDQYLRIVNIPFFEYVKRRIGGGTASAYYPTECLGCFLVGGYILYLFENNPQKYRTMAIIIGIIGYIITLILVTYTVTTGGDIGIGRSQFDINVQMYLCGMIGLVYLISDKIHIVNSERLKKIHSLADKTLGVYIIHPFVMRAYTKIPFVVKMQNEYLKNFWEFCFVLISSFIIVKLCKLFVPKKICQYIL